MTSEFRKQQIRYQIERAISRFPQVIDLMRYEVKTDRYRNKTKTPFKVGTETVFFDTKNAYKITINKDVPSGNINTLKRFYIYAVYREGLEYRIGDFFYIDDIKYRIIYPKCNYELYWICDLEAVLDDKD